MTSPSDDPVAAAVQAALRLLKARSRSRGEMEAALARRDVATDVRAVVLDKLAGWGYLDDTRFARDRARSLCAEGRWGPAGVLRKLQAHGLTAELARAALAEIQAELGTDPRAAARAVLAKKRLTPPLDRKAKAKAARLLASRGFDEDVIEGLLGDPSLDSVPEDE